MSTDNIQNNKKGNQFHPVAEWESAKPDNIIYDRFFYTDRQEVRKVKGRVKIVKRISINGVMTKTACYRKVHWDAYGHCFVGTHNTRSRHLDIKFGDNITRDNH